MCSIRVDGKGAWVGYVLNFGFLQRVLKVIRIPFKGLFLNPSLEHLRSTIMCRQPGFRCSLRLALINMFLVVLVTREMPTVLYLRVAWCCSVQCSDRDLGQHRIVGLPVCIAAKLQHSAAAGLLGHRAVSAGAACCKAAAQQGLDMWCE